MSTHSVTFDEAKDHLPALVDEALRGTEVVIVSEGQPLVKLVPVTPAKTQPRFGSAEGLISMSEDFDEPLDEFSEYMP